MMRPLPRGLRVLLAASAALSASLVRAQGAPSDLPELPEVPDPPRTGAGPDVTVRFPGGYQLADLSESARLDVGGGEPLTLGQVLSSVRRHHPSIEAARAQVRAAEGERLAAEGGFDLSLRAQGWMAPVGYYQWGRGSVTLSQPTPLWGTTFFGGWRIGQALDDPDSDIPDYYRDHETLGGGELMAGVRVPLWRGGPIDGRRRRLWAAQHDVEAEVAGFGARSLALSYEAAAAYWVWAAAGQKYRVAASLLDLAEERDAQIRARVAAGALPAIEALENRRVMLERRRALVSARRVLEQAAIALSMYLRDDAGAPRAPSAARVPEIPAPEPLAVDDERVIRTALSRHPALARYEAVLRRQQVHVDYWENQLAPRIDVQVAASVDLGAGQTERQQSRYESPVVEGSVLIELPLQFREARGGIGRERGNLAAYRERARLARDQVEASVRDALSAVRAAEEGLDLARDAAEVAEAVATAERRRFSLGATQLLIVTMRESHAAEARAHLVEAEATLQIARARFEAATAAGAPPPR